MRVLLVNPSMNLEKLGRVSKLLEPMPPIGVAYIGAALAQHGDDVKLVDMFAEHMGVDEVVAVAREHRPQLVGLTVMTPSAPICQALSEALRQAVPGVKVVWGGVHADVFARELVRDGVADFVVHMDGEHTIVDLVEALEGGATELSDVQGLTWLDSTGPVTNAPRDLLMDLDSLPYPLWEQLPIRRYGLLPFADIAKPVLTITGSRGCPYRCDYCSLLHTGKTFRRRDPMAIVDEYQYLVDRFHVRQIGFVDPIFPLQKADLAPVCEEIARRGLDKRAVWLSETRAERLDKETCELMYMGGCRRVLLGIESGDDELLSNVNKTLKVEAVKEAVNNLREVGIQSVGLFMLGLPGETPEKSRKTVEFAVDLDLDFAKFAITTPFPGSKLFQDRWQKTLFRDDWENYTTFQPDPDRLVYHPDGYDPAELIRMQQWALRRFYARPRQIIKQVFTLRTLSPKNIMYGLYGMVL